MSTLDFSEVEMKLFNRIILSDSLSLVIQAENVRTENSFLIGTAVVCKKFPVLAEEIRKAVLTLVSTKTIDANIKAFDLGRDTGVVSLES